MSFITRPLTRCSALTSSQFLITTPLTLSASRPFHKSNFLSALSESDHGRRELPPFSFFLFFSRLSQKGILWQILFSPFTPPPPPPLPDQAN